MCVLGNCWINLLWNIENSDNSTKIVGPFGFDTMIFFKVTLNTNTSFLFIFLCSLFIVCLVMQWRMIHLRFVWEDGSFFKFSYFNVISECCYLYSLDIQSKVYSNGKLYTCLQLALVFKNDPMSTIIIPSNMIKYDLF
jgi:hypothetical protein